MGRPHGAEKRAAHGIRRCDHHLPRRGEHRRGAGRGRRPPGSALARCYRRFRPAGTDGAAVGLEATQSTGRQPSARPGPRRLGDGRTGIWSRTVKVTLPGRSAGISKAMIERCVAMARAGLFSKNPVRNGRIRASARARWPAVARIAAVTSTLLLAGMLSNPSPASAAPAPVGLGTAGIYLVLGGTGVTNTGATVLSGDLGVSPGTAIVGFPPGVAAGATHAGDPEAAQAQSDLLAAYNDAASRIPTALDFAGDQNGKSFYAGVYHTAAAFALTGTLTLDGQGDPNAVFIFQVGAALNTAAASNVNLINGAQASHVFWQVLGAAGTGASSSFSGTIMALGAITVDAGGAIIGRALSRGLVTLTANTFAFTNTAPPVVAITGGATASTNTAAPTMAGTTNAAAGTTATVTIAGQTLTTTVQTGGTWVVAAATLTEGPHTVVAQVTDPGGNKGSATQTLTLDTTAPIVAITGGATASTNTAKPTIAGTTDAAAGTTVTVTVAGQTLTTTVQTGGTWGITAATVSNCRGYDGVFGSENGKDRRNNANRGYASGAKCGPEFCLRVHLPLGHQKS
ncbi:hypothetical protein DQ354_15725 [Arthrobacter sp. AQ5-06]|nr:hypothetical protein DQ354_15725 [Arthrobacter sp. AQ5-06]